ncbi:ribonuclease P protein component [Nocardioides daeguensis]|uniref:Ribonuclease P protein component n=1 Tax=Nocardioides daeguensis TaxID=908359 RepID=A0ABP6WES5_9ACTN|nr:ribonuclease P protein component [Nocardioides daeguensis]MBV6728129.1 ribonuclease P protein component [Nocardioides daeguensis]MCR1774203.1 ribonuclease P protein component [Nocardioides daeguensis]
MLAADQRLSEPDLFRAASRKGRRAGSRTLVAHLLLPDEQQVVGMSGDGGRGARPARVGFVVSKAVGNAVVRNRVKRRLRHAVRPALADLPAGAVLVVRAQAAAAQASYPELGADLARCLDRVATHAPAVGEEAR